MGMPYPRAYVRTRGRQRSGGDGPGTLDGESDCITFMRRPTPTARCTTSTARLGNRGYDHVVQVFSVGRVPGKPECFAHGGSTMVRFVDNTGLAWSRRYGCDVD